VQIGTRAQSWQQGAYNFACAEKVGFENIFEFESIEFLDSTHQTVTGVIDDYIRSCRNRATAVSAARWIDAQFVTSAETAKTRSEGPKTC
jgi:hypothetical protein